MELIKVDSKQYNRDMKELLDLREKCTRLEVANKSLKRDYRRFCNLERDSKRIEALEKREM